MRLLIGFMILFGALICIQSVRPNCSMSDMTGVEWLICLAR